MKKIMILVIVSILSAGLLPAQETEPLSKKDEKKLLKEQKKQMEAEEAAERARLVDHMVTNQIFVLEADMLYDRYGQSTQVQSSINFILVDTVQGVIQVGNPFYIGFNGVGGVTIQGKVDQYEVRKNEKKNTYDIKFILRSSMGTYDVSLHTSGSGRADAWVSGSFSGKLRYAGRLVHPLESRVYQGTSSY